VFAFRGWVKGWRIEKEIGRHEARSMALESCTSEYFGASPGIFE
jgi:hypothetical protein